MDEIETFKRLGLALAIGLLFGIERGWHTRRQSGGTRVAGVRTFALIGLSGGIAGWLSGLAGPVVLGFLFLGHAALVAVSYWLSSRRDGDLGITTEVAALLAFGLGAAAVMGAMAPAAAGAVLATALLALKSVLHRWIGFMQRTELTAAIELAVISVVMLPLLPNRGFGPGEVLNPYALWWAVVLVAGLSFLGYLAIRIAGARLGTLVTGLFGGLASSTATTLAFARMARRTRTLAPVLAVGTILAGSVTFLRIVLLAGAFDAALARALALPMCAMAGTGLAGAALLHLRAGGGGGDGEDTPLAPANPIALATALQFGAVLALVMLASWHFRQWFGSAGLYAVAAISGITDVDAITISVARMGEEEAARATASAALVLAVSVNTAVKGAIALAIGGRGLGLRVGGVYLAVLGAGAAALRFAP